MASYWMGSGLLFERPGGLILPDPETFDPTDGVCNQTSIMRTKLAVALTIICMKASAQWVEWPVSAGGNGHFYLPVMTTTNISWQDAQRLASGSDAYLATVTSDAENTFVFGLVNSPQWVDTSRGPLLGGYQLEGAQEPAGAWAWVTGEPWVFGSWWPTMPDNGAAGREDALHYMP
ncbi:MAG TPA: hypothetical protein VJS65_11520, partial [Verrucomicrobiae bacterium]|nr:hypothetical protein [Verrucomicrobiae bacterium]